MSPRSRRAAETAAVLAVVAWRVATRRPADLWTDLPLLAAIAWGALAWAPHERARTAVTVSAAVVLFAAYAWRHLPIVLDHLRLVL